LFCEPSRLVSNRQLIIGCLSIFSMKKLKAILLKLATKKTTSPIFDKDPHTFLFLRYDRIGDLIVSLPLVRSLKQLFPKTKMVILASESNEAVASYSELFDEIIVKPPNSTFRWLVILLRLRRRKINVVFDLNHSVAPHALLVCLVVKPNHVASPYKDGRWGVKGTELGIFDIMPSRDSMGYARPIAETYLDIARILGCSTKNSLPYPLDPRPVITKRTKIIFLNHRGSRPNMRITDHDVLQITEKLRTEAPSYAVVIAPESQDYPHLKVLLAGQKNVALQPPTPTVIAAIKLIKESSLVITPDTAIVHIASAFSKPLIAIYANQSELFDQWRPLNSGPTRILFSKEAKSLIGYDSNELIRYVGEFAKLHLT
jgi:ADP-heptose:LPS heptosyltransferase